MFSIRLSLYSFALKCRNIEPLISQFGKCFSNSSSFNVNSNKYEHSILNKCKLCQPLNVQIRNYAKGRDKPKGGKQIQAHLSEDELAEVINVDNFKEELANTIEKLKDDYVKQLSIRSALGSLEFLEIEFEGDKYPLNEIAQVIRKTPTLAIVNAVDFPQAAPIIKKAIIESGMNLNPQQEGTTIYLSIPKVTKEHREELAKNAKLLFEKSKSQLKAIHNKYTKKLKSKEGTVSEDLIFNAQLKIKEMMQDTSAQAETMMKNKQNELLKTTK